MKTGMFYCCLLCVLCAMTVPRGSGPGKTIRCYSLRKEHPSAGNAVLMYPDHNMVCYCDDLVLFSLLSHYDSLVNHKPHSSGVWHFYFMYRKGDTTGVLYDLDHNSFQNHVPVARTLDREWFITFDAYDLFKNQHALISTSGEDARMNGFAETYRLGPDSIHVHATFHYSDRYKTAPFSLSRELDSIKRSKLYFVELFGPLPGVLDSATAERVPLMTYRLDEVDSVNWVRPYFERFLKDSGGGK